MTNGHDNNPHNTCAFCGTTANPIHADSLAQYGEPVCTACYAASFTIDPTNDADSL